jgi:hypothetical protein
LSHSARPFCFSFSNSVSHFYQSQPRLRSSYLHFPHCWNVGCIITPGLLLVEMGLPNFLYRLASNCGPSDLCLPSSWDYRPELPHLTFFFLFFFLETVSCYIFQAGLATCNLLPQPPKCWDHQCGPPCQALPPLLSCHLTSFLS